MAKRKDYAHRTVTLSPELAKDLRQLASSEDRSQSAIVRRAITLYKQRKEGDE